MILLRSKIIIPITIIINLLFLHHAYATSGQVTQTAEDRARLYAEFLRNREPATNSTTENLTSNSHMINEFNSYQQELTQAKSNFDQAELLTLKNYIVNIDEFKASHAGAVPTLKDETLNDFITAQVQLVEKYQNSGNPLLKTQIDNTLNLINTEISELFSNASKAKGLSELASFQMPDSLTGDSLLVTNNSVNNLINIRINEAIGRGISSGDDTEHYGSWVKAIYTSANQKSFKITPGYKSNQTGMIVGFDAGEDSKIGAAYSFVNSNIKGKNVSSKEEIHNHYGSIYGLLVISDNLFADGQLSYGISDIKKQRKNDDTNRSIASGKTKANTLNVQALLGYDFKVDGTLSHIIPTIGIESTQCNIKGYKETGNGLNRKVNKRNVTKTSVISGLINQYEIDMRDHKIVPEIYAHINYAISRKNDNTKITLTNNTLPITIPSTELSKIIYNLGSSLKLSYKALNFGVGYDLNFGKKFISNTGSIKIRADF